MGNKQEGGGGLSKSNSKRLAASGHGETTTLPASSGATKTQSTTTLTPPANNLKSSNSGSGKSDGGSDSSPGSAPPKPPASSEKVTWGWEDDTQGVLKFINYDDETNQIIEKAFATGVDSVVITHGFFGQQGGYKIDFKGMVQVKTATGFTRTIQRVAVDLQKHTTLVKSRSGAIANAPKGIKLNDKGLVTVSEEDVQRLVDPNASGFAKPAETKKEIILRLTNYTSVPANEHECAICLCELDENVVELSKCKHQFHEDCIVHAGDPKGFLKCPSCGLIYGVRIGAMPRGTMRVDFKPKGAIVLEGFADVGVIQVHYSFPNGTQGVDHPDPGKPYNGTSRTAYLPHNKEGSDILELLQLAFWRKLTFRIGTSVTTGEQNAVVWNGIHHKTSTHGGIASWGYPDATYFERVLEELGAVGITMADLKDGKTSHEVKLTENATKERVIQVY